MSLWRDLLRLLGLSSDARAQVSAPGIDVVISGEPEQVRAVLGVVRAELERLARARDPGLKRKLRESQVVRPTELDEMDSPYVLAQAGVLRQGKAAAAPDPAQQTVEQLAQVAARLGDPDSGSTTEPPRARRSGARREEPEPELTAVESLADVSRSGRHAPVDRGARVPRPRAASTRAMDGAAGVQEDTIELVEALERKPG